MLGCLRMQTLIAILTDPHAAAKLSDHSKAHRAKMEILLEEQNRLLCKDSDDLRESRGDYRAVNEQNRLLCKDSDDPSDNRNSRFLCLEKPGGGGRLLL